MKNAATCHTPFKVIFSIV